ncbi:lipopolysaccharide biosynthesis protein [Saccharothrix obliqua]|uniref:lipopolysaccharide biosynthesis protein n=1 Tax=Saccharothrix obliqua TaxID=2861747 RepID=UPI001C5E2ADB|nr:hypothetical protein [Saccharothrix obliqua]MBW4720777.1 hypothetical protein [Saccharothrix obliqua]
MTSGLLVNAYLAIVARNVSPAEYAHFGSFWSLALVVGFGVFLPVEQELARLLPGRSDRRTPARSALAVAGVIGLVELAVVLAATPLLLDSFGGHGLTMAALAAMCLVSAGQFVVRGLLIGLNRMGTYGLVQVLDTALRVALALTVGLFGVSDSAGFAWTLVIAVLLAHLPVAPLLLRRVRETPAVTTPPAEPVTTRRFAGAVAPLLLGSLCAQLLLNGLPVAVPLMAGPGEQDAAGHFLAAFLLARIPLFVAVPLQSVLLPSMAALADAGRGRLVRALLRLAAGLAVLAACGVAVAWTFGPWLVRLVFGAAYVIEPGDLALIVLGVIAHLGLVITTQALVASALHPAVAWSWLCGIVVAGVAFAVVPGLLLRTELAFLLGSGAGWLFAMIYLVAHSRRPSPTREDKGAIRAG